MRTVRTFVGCFLNRARWRKSQVAGGVRARAFLIGQFGAGRWRKLKGVAEIEMFTAEIRTAEIHWYEARGIGRRMIKRKFFLDESR